MPQDFKVSFEYESFRNVESDMPTLRTMMNLAFLVGAIVVGRRVWDHTKKIMKGSGQGPLDIDTKKIEAIKPENIKTQFKDVAGMHEAKF